MVDRWSGWMALAGMDGAIQATTEPGLFEVCVAATREQVAFGCTGNVAESLRDVLKPRGVRKWLAARRAQPRNPADLEYRVWPSRSYEGAKAAMELVQGRHSAVMRRYAGGARF